MKKKFLPVLLLVSILLLNLAPFGAVAESVGRPNLNVQLHIEAGTTYTLYAGEIFVDGEATMQYLYSEDIPQAPNFTNQLKDRLPERFASLIPEDEQGQDADEPIDEPEADIPTGLAFSTDHQEDMNADWKDASLVAPNYFGGSLEDIQNVNLYDIDEGFKKAIDDDLTALNDDLEEDEQLPVSKKLMVVTSIRMEQPTYQMIGGNLTQIQQLVLGFDDINVIYTSVNVNTKPEPASKKYTLKDGIATVIFTFQEGFDDLALHFVDVLELSSSEVEKMSGVPASKVEEMLAKIKEQLKDYGDVLGIYAITIENDRMAYSDALRLQLQKTSAMKGYSKFLFVFLDENKNFVVTDVYDFTDNGNSIYTDLDHLSAYALVGIPEEEPQPNKKSPDTGDMTIPYMALTGLAGATFLFKKKKEK